MFKRLFLLVAVAVIPFIISIPVLASVNSFTISNYAINYQLSRDDSKRSKLRTVETITAQFPQANQNHGLERAIPKEHNEHPVDVTIESIEDLKGNPVPYHLLDDDPKHTLLRIGDNDTFVHGE